MVILNSTKLTTKINHYSYHMKAWKPQSRSHVENLSLPSSLKQLGAGREVPEGRNCLGSTLGRQVSFLLGKEGDRSGYKRYVR